jgi:type IV pilus secretin PilQ/predicted competence protein
MFYLNRRVQRIAQSGSLPALFLVVGMAYGAAVSGCGLAPSKGLPVNGSQAAAQSPTVRSQPVTKEEQNPSGVLKLQDLSVREEDGQTTLSIKFSQPIDGYRHYPLPQPSRIIVDISGDVKASSHSETYRIDTHWVGILRLTSTNDSIRLSADITAASVPPYTVTRETGGIKIVIGTFNPAAMVKKEITLVTGGVRADIPRAEAAAISRQSIAQSDAVTQARSDEKQYTGQKISLEFKDADIKNVFRLLAEVSSRNIVVTDDVSRKITVRLVEIPWDQALDLIVQMNGLAKEEVGNVIRISTAGLIKSEREALAAAKKAKVSIDEIETAYLTVNYAKAKDLVDKVLDKIKPTLSPRGVIVPDDRSNMIVVRDTKQGVEDALKIISRLDVRTPQVQIESNLIETSPNFARALGTELAFSRGGLSVDSVLAARQPFAQGTNALGATFSVIQDKVGGLRNLNATLSAAESEGKVKIISRPSVVTLNNQDSTIKSERILRVRLPDGTSSTGIGTSGPIAGTNATEKIPVGISLTVTPQVSVDGFILMKIKVKSSSITAVSCCGGAIGDELSREAEANVLIRDGETVVIGGIMKDNQEGTEDGIPYIKDIPVFGWLFKRVREVKEFEELMVFITPRIISSGADNLPMAERIWREQLQKTEGDGAISGVPAP